MIILKICYLGNKIGITLLIGEWYKMVKVRIGAVVSEFNYDITHMMLELAKEHAKFLDSEITKVIAVPGVFDMPLAIKNLLREG